MKTAKIIVTVSCAVGAILFLGAGFVLYRGVGRFNTARENLENVKRDLDRYYKAKPFPSEDNVDRELANTKQVDTWFNSLMSTLEGGNVTSTERSPSRFKIAVEASSRNLIKAGQKAGAELPPTGEFAFGFDRYAGTSGTLPKPQDVPRLMEQLVIVNRLCLVLFKHRVKGLTKVERDEFEVAGEAAPAEANPASSSRRSSRRGSSSSRSRSSGTTTRTAPRSAAWAGIIGEDDLYAKMHFAFEFRAKEKALLDILNALSANRMFITVTSISLSKPTPELVPVVTDPEDEGAVSVGFSAATKPTESPEAQKLGPNYPVCGVKMEIPMDVRLELDVYKFREATVDSGD
jgi:hypothetical protein